MPRSYTENDGEILLDEPNSALDSELPCNTLASLHAKLDTIMLPVKITAILLPKDPAGSIISPDKLRAIGWRKRAIESIPSSQPTQPGRHYDPVDQDRGPEGTAAVINPSTDQP